MDPNLKHRLGGYMVSVLKMPKPHRYVSSNEKPDDTVIYRVLNDFHRADGPAVTCDRRWAWYLFGKWHRYYGPTRWKNQFWHIHGKCVK